MRTRQQTEPPVAGHYEIIVEGVAGPVVESAFADCRVDVRTAATRLQPLEPDEAALFGVLARVRDLGLTLIEIRQIDGGGGGRESNPPSWDRHDHPL